MSYLAGFIFWFCYFPLIKILGIILWWHPKIHQRVCFEKKNDFEKLACSFRSIGNKADYCFEFSSEGEFQQIAPLMDDLLKDEKKIELVFFSPSVEKAILKIAALYPKQVRYLRYPLIRIFPFVPARSFTNWVTSEKLIMVRYDLFPEFLLWSFKKGHKLKLLWVSFKKERSKNRGPSAWKRYFLKSASTLVFAGQADQDHGRRLGLFGEIYDFRVEQIRRRVKLKADKFKDNFVIYPEFLKLLKGAGHYPTLIMGNAWPSDLFLLRDLPKDLLIVIVPHNLSEKVMTLFKEELMKMGRAFTEISDTSTSIESSSTVLLNKKGILCELYSDFNYAYVGGGFEGSVHSVLEPLVAGSLHLSCGPFHHRSTEYDVAESLGRILEVNTPEQFFTWINNSSIREESDRMNRLFADYNRMREIVISC